MVSQVQGFVFPKLLTKKRRVSSILFRNLRFTRTNGRCRFFENGKAKERTRSAPLSQAECSKVKTKVLTESIENMNAKSINYWLWKFVQEVADKSGGRYPSRTLYNIICGLKRFFVNFVVCVRCYLLQINLLTSQDFSRISGHLDIVSKSLKIFIQFFIGYPNTCTWCGIQAVICSWLYELLMSLRKTFTSSVLGGCGYKIFQSLNLCKLRALWLKYRTIAVTQCDMKMFFYFFEQRKKWCKSFRFLQKPWRKMRKWTKRAFKNQFAIYFKTFLPIFFFLFRLQVVGLE